MLICSASPDPKPHSNPNPNPYTGAEGGGCAQETDAACMAAAKPYVLTPTAPGDLYLSCSVSDHCINGQRTEPGPQNVWTDEREAPQQT